MKKLYLTTVASCLAMMSYGLLFGWTSPSLPLLLQDDSPVPLSLPEATWVTCILNLGAALSVTFCMRIVNVIGRKWTLVLTAIPAVIGWLMIAFATSAWQLYTARFISGFSNGSGYVAVMMYMGEISPANIRGILTSVMTVSAKIGTLTEWTIGPFLSVRDLALASLSFPILFAACMAWLPESPYHLMRRGRRLQAIEALAKLRGTMDVSEEMDTIEKSIKIDLANDAGLRELVGVSGNRKALTVVLGLMFVQQCSGSMAIISYAQMTFNATGNQFEGKYVTMIVGVVQVVCAAASTAIVDRFGRRKLLVISAAGTGFSTALIGLFFYIQSSGVYDVRRIVWLPAIGVILYIFMYAFGLAGLPFTLISELFPTNVKALGSALGIMSCNGFSFVVTLSYQSIAADFGLYTVFWIFTVVSLLGVFFVYAYVPETRGRTLQEVQEKLHDRKLF